MGWAALLAMVAVLGAILVWQFGTSPPTFRRATLQERARGAVRQALEDSPEAQPAQVRASFTRPDIPGQHTLLVEVHVQRRPGVTARDDELRRRIAERIRRALERQGYTVTPLVDVTVLPTPGARRSPGTGRGERGAADTGMNGGRTWPPAGYCSGRPWRAL